MKNSLYYEPVDVLNYQTLQALNNDLSQLSGRRIKIKGYFDHSKGCKFCSIRVSFIFKASIELKLGLRSAPVSLAGSAQGLAMNPQVLLFIWFYYFEQ